MTLVEMLRANGSWEADAAATAIQVRDRRIEKLEAANLKQSCIKIDDQMRIEKLEAALRAIAYARPECCCISDAMQGIARKALEGKDG
jgi:hypothetical protein